MNVFPIPAFADNYIWALHEGAHCVVVDPGDAAPVEAWLSQMRLSLAAILITHHHPDHVGGIEGLRGRYPNVPVYGPANENIPNRTHALRDGDEITLDEVGTRFEIWEVPGHTNGHIAYIAQGRAFVGDTLFAAGCGRLFEGTPAQMYASLSRLAALPDDTQIFCTHEYTLSNLRFALAAEPDNDALIQRSFEEQSRRERHEPTVPFPISIERATNPFLRAHEPTIQKTLRDTQRLGEGASPVEAFAALREWKNHFR
jgi:hydroxyacylglutathione hydrolase